VLYSTFTTTSFILFNFTRSKLNLLLTDHTVNQYSFGSTFSYNSNCLSLPAHQHVYRPRDKRLAEVFPKASEVEYTLFLGMKAVVAEFYLALRRDRVPKTCEF
ncbi:MAG TPA: hypothetical protein V6D04_01765, partial [Candidatus Obscuribacterales bacterium]